MYLNEKTLQDLSKQFRGYTLNCDIYDFGGAKTTYSISFKFDGSRYHSKATSDESNSIISYITENFDEAMTVFNDLMFSYNVKLTSIKL